MPVAREDTGRFVILLDLAVELNTRARRVRCGARATGMPAAAVAHTCHLGREYVFPAKCENANDAV